MNADGMVCCQAYSSECLACNDGVDVETWCKNHKEFNGPGCEPAVEEPKDGMICCQAYHSELTA